MRILLEPGDHDLRNKGNVSMLQVAVKRFRNLWPDAQIGVVTRAPNILKHYCPEAIPVTLENKDGWSVSQRDKLFQYIPRLFRQLLLELREEARYQSYLSDKNLKKDQSLSTSSNDEDLEFRLEMEEGKEIVNEDKGVLHESIKNVDLVVASGGGIMCDIAKNLALPVLKTLEMAIRCNIPTAMVGQQIGPIQDPQLMRRVKAILPVVNYIAIREERIAKPLLNSLGVDLDRVTMTGDDAIELAYVSRLKEMGTGIGISVRVQWYMGITDNHLKILRSVLHRVATRYEVPLISLPISYAFHEADSQMNRNIFLNGFENVIDVSGKRFQDPIEIVKSVGRCRVVVTGTFHGAVYALAQGIPVVGIVKSTTYKDKFLGLANEFSSGCEIVHLDDEQLAERLNGAIDTAWQSAEEMKPKLLEDATRQIERGRAAYQRIYEMFEEIKRNQQSNPKSKYHERRYL